MSVIISDIRLPLFFAQYFSYGNPTSNRFTNITINIANSIIENSNIY